MGRSETFVSSKVSLFHWTNNAEANCCRGHRFIFPYVYIYIKQQINSLLRNIFKPDVTIKENCI